MGQAKQRGTFEQRQAEAIQREADRAERQRIEREQRREAERVALACRPAPAAPCKGSHNAFGRTTMLAATMLALGVGLSSTSPAAKGANKP